MQRGDEILLTGASGLVGSRVAEQLAGHGHRVRALLHRTAVPEGRVAPGEGAVPAAGGTPGGGNAAGGRIVAVRGALEDASALARAVAGAAVVVHAAARMAGSGEEIRETNVAGTERLARAAARAGVRRFVLLGSATIYAPGPLIGADESASVGAPDRYGASKAEAEEVAREALGDRVVVLRPCSVYRTGRCPLLEAIASVATRPELPLVDRGQTPIDLVHADDLAQAVRLAVEAPGSAFSPAFHVAGPAPAPFRGLVESVASVLGATPRWIPNPRRDRFDAFLWRVASQPRTLSIDRARRELGYAPAREWSVEVPRAARAALGR